MSRPSAARGGMTLIEVGLAMVLLLLAFLPLGQLFQLTTAQTIQSRHHLVAEQVARSFFELYPSARERLVGRIGRHAEVTDCLSDPTRRDLVTGHSPVIAAILKEGAFRMQATIDRGVGGKSGLDQVVVTMDWTEEGRPRRQSYGRIIAP